MTNRARLLSNPVVAKVEGIDDNTKLLLSDAMSYVVEGHEHMPNAGGWDGRSTLYDWKSGKFPAGFIPTAINILKQAKYDVERMRKPLPAPLGPTPTPENPLIDDFAPDDRYDYQFKAMRILEKHGNFIARIATGGGKSRVAGLCIKRIGRKTLFITTRRVLLYQMGKALKKAGFKISYCGDSQWDTSGDVVLAMVPTIADRLTPFAANLMKMTPDEVILAEERWKRKNQEALDLLDQIEFVIGEEAHESGSTGYFTVLKHCKRAAYRLALTATPLMRDGESNMRLIAMFGPIRLEVSEKTLIDRGILARPIFKFKKMRVPPTLRRGSAWTKAEDLGIINNQERNKWICAEAVRATRWGLSTMILVRRRRHGKVLCDILRRAGVRVEYIFGESNTAKRDAALEALEKGKLDVLIGSTILDVGVDVPAVGMVILAGGGKAEVQIRQRIGRGMRAKKNGPNVCFFVDFSDMTNKHLIKHSKQRIAIVEQTPGFAEGILAANDDFDFVGLGFRRPLRNAA